jgi:hypothetical protein
VLPTTEKIMELVDVRMQYHLKTAMAGEMSQFKNEFYAMMQALMKGNNASSDGMAIIPEQGGSGKIVEQVHAASSLPVGPESSDHENSKKLPPRSLSFNKRERK